MNEVRAKRPPPQPPSTIGYSRGQGVRSAYVSCGNSVCQRGSSLTFDEIGLPDDTPIPEIATRKEMGMSAVWVAAGGDNAELAASVRNT